MLESLPMITLKPASSVPLRISTTLPASRFAARMAGVTGLAVVLIIWHAGVVTVSVGLVMLVAKDTLEDVEIVGIDMTIGADCPPSLMPA